MVSAPASDVVPNRTLPSVESAAAILDEALAGDIEVPPFPSMARQIHQAVTDGAAIEEIARIVGADAALAADVLRIVNTAMYAARGAPITSIARAISRLGTRHVERLALAAGLTAGALRNGSLRPLRVRFCREALAAAGLCEALAETRRADADVAYLAGLLHDFGKVLLVECIEQYFGGLGADLMDAAPTWIEIIDTTHARAGHRIASAWQLPAPLPDVMALHHEDARTLRDPMTAALVDLVRAADDVVALLRTKANVTLADLQKIARLRSDEERSAVMRVIGELPALLATLRVDVSDAVHVVRPPFPGRVVRTAIATRILSAKSTGDLTTVAISRSGFSVMSAAPIRAGWASQVELALPSGPLRMWVCALSSAEVDPGTFVSDLKLFKLDPAARERWFELVDQAHSAPH
jgi:HD-like signal output (HDOD) protein